MQPPLPRPKVFYVHILREWFDTVGTMRGNLVIPALTMCLTEKPTPLETMTYQRYGHHFYEQISVILSLDHKSSHFTKICSISLYPILSYSVLKKTSCVDLFMTKTFQNCYIFEELFWLIRFALDYISPNCCLNHFGPFWNIPIFETTFAVNLHLLIKKNCNSLMALLKRCVHLDFHEPS